MENLPPNRSDEEIFKLFRNAESISAGMKLLSAEEIDYINSEGFDRYRGPIEVDDPNSPSGKRTVIGRYDQLGNYPGVPKEAR